MTTSAYRDPIASMATMPMRAFAPPAAAPFVGPSIRSFPAAQSAPPLGWSTHLLQQTPAMAVPVVGPDRQLQRLALGLLLTVLLLGIPLAAYLASMT